MEKKVVLITGCSSGIGLSLAVRLASDPDKTYKGKLRTSIQWFNVEGIKTLSHKNTLH